MDLKELWNEINDQSYEDTSKISLEAKANFLPKSKVLVQSLLKRIDQYNYFNIILGCFTIGLCFYLKFPLLIIVLLFLTMILMSINILYAAKKIKDHSIDFTKNLKEVIDNSLIQLNAFINIEKYFSIIFTPILTAFALIYIKYQEDYHLLAEPKTIAIITCTSIAIGIIIYFFTKIYYKKIFGSFLSDLEALQKELHSPD